MSAASANKKVNLMPKKGASAVVWQYFGYRRTDVNHMQVLCKMILRLVKTTINMANVFNNLKKNHHLLIRIEW